MTISTLKEAWRSMYHLRTCPPSNIINDPAEKSQIEQHQRTCPICALTKHPPLDPELWSTFGQILSDQWTRPHVPEIQAGQVWSLVSTKGGWDDSFWHINPPLVLILEIFEDVDGVRVAQIFDQPELFADGDVDLGQGLGFAETWNTYALDQADLHLCFGQVDQAVVDLVHAQSQGEWAAVEDQSTLWFFRQLELDVGSRMAMEAMGRLMYRHDHNVLRTTLAFPDHVRTKVLDFDPSITLPEAETGLIMLARAEFPVQLLAAATKPGQMSFTIVTIGQTNYPCHSALADIQTARLDESTIRVSGILPDTARRGHLFAWWHRPHSGFWEGQATFDAESGYFRADFADKNSLDFELGELVLLFADTEHEDQQ